MPQLAIPVIMYTIFSSIIFSNGALLNMAGAIKTIVLLLKAFTTGFAISLAVGLLVVPTNCREVWWKILGGYLEVSKALLREQVLLSRHPKETGLLRLCRNRFCSNMNLCRPTICLPRVKKRNRMDHIAARSPLFRYHHSQPFRRPILTSL